MGAFDGVYSACFVEAYCACGESFKYTFATESAQKDFRKVWNAKHTGFGHVPVDAVQFQALAKADKQKRVNEAKAREGTFEFMKDEVKR